MYRISDFKNYFLNTLGATKNTYRTYNSFLGRIDAAIGGLDEAISKEGIDSVINWGKSTDVEPFSTYRSHAKSVLKRYLQFVVEADTQAEGDDVIDELELDGDTEAAAGTVFQLEREMQAAVRKQLGALEPGLTEADNGSEARVGNWRIDVLARDQDGKLVVIELKAGLCPPGALEQTLGYAQALAEERGEPVRAYLIAAEFPDRIRAASKRVNDLCLRTYEFSMRFNILS